MGGSLRMVIVVLLVAGSACGAETSTSDSDGAATASVAGSSVVRADDDVAAQVDEVLAMDDGDRDDALVEIGLDMQSAVAAMSGLEAELGGADATREALLAAWAPIVTSARSTADDAPVLGLRRGAGPVPSLGEGMFGGFLVVGLGAGAAASATSGRQAGPPISEKSGDITISASQNRGELSVDTTHTDAATGVTTALKAKVSMMPCPDATGRFEASATVDVTASKGAASQRGVLQVDLVGMVNDNADLASVESTFDLTWSRGGGGGAAPDAMVNVAVSGGQATVTHPNGGPSDLDSSSVIGAHIYGAMVEHQITSSAKQAWSSGLCVQLDLSSTPGAKEVKPGGTADLDAKPRSRIDGGPTGGTVEVTAFEGVRSIEPSASKLDADATFLYTAPGSEDRLPNDATITLEARSRRGVATAKYTFEVDRVVYVASGQGENITFSGTVKDIERVEVTGEFIGGSATFEFVSDDDDGVPLSTGKVMISGGGSGATVTGAAPTNGRSTATARSRSRCRRSRASTSRERVARPRTPSR